jgi:hypothetical protein
MSQLVLQTCKSWRTCGQRTNAVIRTQSYNSLSRPSQNHPSGQLLSSHHPGPVLTVPETVPASRPSPTIIHPVNCPKSSMLRPECILQVSCSILVYPDTLWINRVCAVNLVTGCFFADATHPANHPNPSLFRLLRKYHPSDRVLILFCSAPFGKHNIPMGKWDLTVRSMHNSSIMVQYHSSSSE